jgi:hypothetical protein
LPQHTLKRNTPSKEDTLLDFIDTVVTAGLIVFIVSSLLVFMEASRGMKLALGAALGLWTGLAGAAAGAGWLTIGQPPVVGIFVAVPLIGAALFASSASGRRALLSLPLPLIAGLNICRVFAVMFLVLAAQGRLSGPFPYSAALGDIITGLAAIPMLRLMQDKEANAAAIQAWNAFGLADLVVAIGLGVMSADGSLLQVFAAPGSTAMQGLPWSFVPTVLVPLWMILHAVVWAKVRQARSTRLAPG